MLFPRRRSQWLGALGVLLFGGQAAEAITLDLSSTDSIKQAASTVAYGLMSYYKGNETGMSIGLLPDPYYWWEAGALMGQMVDYWWLTGDDTYNDVVSQAMLAQVGPNNDYMPPNQTKTEGNDDQDFWGFAAMTAAESKFPDPPPDKPSWLSLAQAIFNLQVSRWDTEFCGGGLRWQIFTFNKGYNYKNSISNGGFFQLSARLARYTQNETYALWAEKIYDWIQTTPLFTDDYLIYDGGQIENNCTIADKLQWTYNVGTFLMGAANMYNYTNGTNTKWRTAVEGLVNGSTAFFPDQFGSNIMVEIACEPQGTCNYDQPSFKAYLSRWMGAATQLAPFTAQFLNPKLHDSAEGAAAQCSGGSNGQTCGRAWHQSTWDGKQGVGEQMSALSIIQANLVSKVGPPASAQSGGTSKSNPAAGSQGDANIQQVTDPELSKPISSGDRVAASFLTALALSSSFTIQHGSPSPAVASSLARLRHRQLCLRALFPKGNKAVTTTAPYKKRKLSPRAVVQEPVQTKRSSTTPQLAQTNQPTLTPSLPVPRYLPPHLIQDRARQGRSPTPEPPNTGSSSPSGAYAGLNIDSDGSGYDNGSGPESASHRRRRSLAQTGLQGGAANYRTASPAKRRASAMEGVTRDQEDVADATMTDNSLESNSAESTGQTRLAGTGLNGKPKGSRSQHKREASVDMVGNEQDDSSGAGSLQTPQSGGSTSGLSSGETPPAVDLPPIDDQIKEVMTLAQQNTMHEGDKGFVVASKWLSRVLSRGADAVGSDKYGKEAREGPIGAVDNSGLELVLDAANRDFIDEKGEKFVTLRPGLQISDDFEILPQAAWKLIVKWYGIAKGSSIITRYCHNTSTSEIQENLQFEIYPPVFTLLKLPDRSSGIQHKDLREKDLPPVKLLASRHELYQTFLKRAKLHADIEPKTKVRVWRILGRLGDLSIGGMITPAQSRSSSPAPGAIIPVDPGNKLVLDVNTFSQLQLGSQRELIDAKDETANEKYNGHSRLDVVGLRQDEVIVLEEQIGGPAGGEWVSDSSTARAKTNSVAISVTKSGATTVQNSLKPSAASSRGTSPAPGGMMTRGRQNKNGRIRGTIGLNNLGNTCYMNSALQCVRSVEELTTYFLEDKYKKELNPSNPLSHNGDVAKVYAKLLHEMYSPTCTASFAPRNFKNVIGKYGPSFSGYQQQDSQEFLLFLLDGLQEDLNRIDKKPYIEKPDSTDAMVKDPVALREMADKCWDIYKKRNDSVITDLFAGMYKSTVVCPVCDKVSIIFDPFNNLTLQLPIENVWTRNVYFFPLHSRPILVSVDIDKNSTWSAAKDFIAARFRGVDPRRLVCAEIYKSKFYRIFDDKNTVGEENISDGDQISVFEVEDHPTNHPPPKKASAKRSFPVYPAEELDIPEGDSPLADQQLVSIFHRRTKESSSRYTQKSFFGMPSFIVVSREEAQDYDAILQKVLGKVANLTTRPFLKEDGAATEDSDTVILNADDSSDTKVQAESLESEDGMIDISMKDESDEKAAATATAFPCPDLPNTTAPMLQSGSFITPEVRNLFDMKYHLSNSEMVPLGFTTFSDEGRDFPSISARQETTENTKAAEGSSTKEKLRNRVANIGDSPPGSDDEIDDALPSAQPSVEEDASDDDGLPPIEKIIQPSVSYGGPRNREKGRNNKSLITYSRKDSRKGKELAVKNRGGGDTAETESGLLIRLGECIIVDWTSEGYEALFSGVEGSTDEEEEMRGAPTWVDIPTLPDPELETKRKSRISRKRSGFSLDDCLDEFGKSETLSENDAWYCPRCKEHRRATKTFELWKAPDILVIHLKRFSAQGRLRDKLDVLVDFPTDGLDLSSRLATQDDTKSPIYDLFGVDNHYGGLGGGHYTAFAKNFFDNNWYEYNDSSVSRKNNPKAVITSAAYLLFYRRREPAVLGGPFFEQLHSGMEEPPSDSQPTSRAASPAGEGKRLDGSSRNGSSSALRGVGAAHQAGDGGPEVGRMRTGVDDELPAYATVDPRRLQPDQQDTLEDMELDDEGIGMEDSIEETHGPFLDNPYDAPAWSFDNLASSGGGPHVSRGSSVKASGSISDASDRMADFADDEGTTMGPFSTPPRDTVPMDVPLRQEYDDEPVAEVRVPQDEDDELKMD